MNIKYALVNVIVTYTAMIGVASASPPLVEPIAVETIEGSPLEVIVTNTVTPTHFQIILSVDLENGFSETSDPFMVENGSTALIEYIACEYTHAIGDSSSFANIELVADVVDKVSNDKREVIIIWPDLTEHSTLTPAPRRNWVSNNLVSACIGSKCESMSDVQYSSLKLRAFRNTFITDPEHAECLIKGIIY